MKRGLRRLFVLVSVAAGACVAVGENRTASRVAAACKQAAISTAGDAIVMCRDLYTTELFFYWPLTFGVLAFAGSFLLLEAARAIVAWVIRGFAK